MIRYIDPDGMSTTDGNGSFTYTDPNEIANVIAGVINIYGQSQDSESVEANPGGDKLDTHISSDEVHARDDDQPQSGQGELSANSMYTIRENKVTGTTLFSEFLDGTGPEYSAFADGHPMVEDLKKSYIMTLAKIEFVRGRYKPIRRYDAPFGIIGAGMSSSMTEQVIGGARITIIPTSNGIYYQVDNTMDSYSYHAHTGESIPRAPGTVTPQGTIYQRFAWFEKN